MSIITATYNCVGTVGSACEALAGQVHPDIEWIVVDGASTDGTLEAIKRSARQPDILVSEPDKGIYDALNKGVELATGEVVGLLHSDDFYPDRGVLGKVAEVFGDPAVDAVYGDLQYVRESGSREAGEMAEPSDLQDCRAAALRHFSIVRDWRSGEYDRKKLEWGWMPPHPALYLRRDVYERVKLSDGRYFDTAYSCAADYDLMMRVLSGLGVVPVYLPEVLMKMRLGGVSNRSLKHIVHKSMEDWQVIRRNKLGHCHTLLMKNISKLQQFWRRPASGDR